MGTRVCDVDRHEALGLAACIAFCEAAGIVPSLATRDAIPEWYAALEKPPETPPGWVFGPVWTFLYAVMGVALHRVVVERDRRTRSVALALFCVQLALNAAWTFVFFGGRSTRGGLAVLGLLLPAVALTTLAFLLVNPIAGLLLVPYLAWTAFATRLNVGLARAN